MIVPTRSRQPMKNLRSFKCTRRFMRRWTWSSASSSRFINDRKRTDAIEAVAADGRGPSELEPFGPRLFVGGLRWAYRLMHTPCEPVKNRAPRRPRGRLAVGPRTCLLRGLSYHAHPTLSPWRWRLYPGHERFVEAAPVSQDRSPWTRSSLLGGLFEFWDMLELFRDEAGDPVDVDRRGRSTRPP